jgi:hypothetical protein
MLLFWVATPCRLVGRYLRLGRNMLSPSSGIYLPASLHGVTTKDNDIVILTAVRTSNITTLLFSLPLSLLSSYSIFFLCLFPFFFLLSISIRFCHLILHRRSLLRRSDQHNCVHTLWTGQLLTPEGTATCSIRFDILVCGCCATWFQCTKTTFFPALFTTVNYLDGDSDSSSFNGCRRNHLMFPNLKRHK